MELSWSDFPDLTLLIRRAQSGDKEAESQFFNIGYQHLKRLAARQLRRESRPGDATPQDLLHDVYVSRIRAWRPTIEDRDHYAALVCRAIRSELCDRARKRDALKRTPPYAMKAGKAQIPGLALEETLAVEREIARMSAVDPRAAQVVHLRYYGGCSWEETARATGTSVREVRNDWAFASKWLAKRLGHKFF